MAEKARFCTPGNIRPGDKVYFGGDYRLVISIEKVPPAGSTHRRASRYRAVLKDIHWPVTWAVNKKVLAERAEPAEDSYDAALKRSKGNIRNCDDAAFMASLCQNTIPVTCGAVSGRLVWQGAMAKGMTSQELAALASEDPLKVADLMWVPPAMRAEAGAEHDLEGRVS